MKKYVLLTLFSIILMLSCAGDEKSLVIIRDGERPLVFRNLEDVPKEVEVEGFRKIFSQKYAISVHYQDPNRSPKFLLNGDIFEEGPYDRGIKKNGKKRNYRIWFHSNVKGANYLNEVFHSTTIIIK